MRIFRPRLLLILRYNFFITALCLLMCHIIFYQRQLTYPSLFRLEDTLNLNSKLDHHVKNKDEKIKELESLLQAEEDR